MSRAWPIVAAESSIDRHFKEIQRFPMLDPQDEYLLAKRWREAGDRDAAPIVAHLLEPAGRDQ
jgi:RNA polymerase sigma-32 factor